MNNVENQAAAEIEESVLDDISGGPIFMKYEGVEGWRAASTTGGIQVALGDGSVRAIRD